MQTNEGDKAFKVSSALVAHRRVKLSSGYGDRIEYAGAGEACIGVTTEAQPTTLSYCNVRLKTSGRTFQMTAAEAFAAGASLYGGADGKVQDTSTGTAEATALEAATADGDVVECLFL